MATIDQAELDRLKAMCAAATAPPWRVNSPWGMDDPHDTFVIDGPEGGMAVVSATLWEGGISSRADADLIAEARTALPALIAALEEMQGIAARTLAAFVDQRAAAVVLAAQTERLTRQRDHARAATRYLHDWWVEEERGSGDPGRLPVPTLAPEDDDGWNLWAVED